MPSNVELPQYEGDEDSQNKVSHEGRLIKNVTFFGDAALEETHQVYKDVWEAAKLLASEDYTIVNGGGPGVMKAATDGAESVDGHTIAVYWQPKLAAYFEGKNLANVTDESKTASNYMMRTLGLVEKGDAYVVCKGGTGTISEFGMVWALSKLYYGCHKPVILYGDFWDEFIENIQEHMYIDEIEVGVLYTANSPEEILNILQKHEKKISHCRKKTPAGDEAGFLIGGRVTDVNYTNIEEGRGPQIDEGKSTNQSVSPQLDETTKNYNQVAANYHSDRAGRLASIEQLEEFSSIVNPPAKVLDVGAGPGYDAKYLSEKYNVIAIEKSKRFVEICKYENPDIEVYNADILDFPLQSGTYKGIWARDSLHHLTVDKREAVFKKLADALVEDGILYVIVREGTKEGMEDKGVGQYQHEVYINEYTIDELTEVATKVGLSLEKIEKTQRSHHWLVGVFRKS
jgi:hypothetical protein